MTFHDLRVQVHPGAGIVANFGAALVVCLPVSPAHQSVADGLLATVEQAAARGGAPARSIARGVTDLLGQVAPAAVPAFAILSPAEDGLALILQGAMEFELEQQAGRSVLSGRDALTWVDRLIKGDFMALEIRPCAGGGAPDSRSRLVTGVVPGSGVTILAPGNERWPAEPPPVAANAVVPLVPLVPLVSIVPGVPGVLVGDDGSTLDLDDNYVLGREPFDHPQVAGGIARPFVFLDCEAEISRAHTMITVQGGDVSVTDLASANGTFISAPGSGQWQELEPGTPTSISPGFWLLVGKRTFEYRSAS